LYFLRRLFVFVRKAEKFYCESEERLITTEDLHDVPSLVALCGLDESSFDIDAQENLKAGVGIGLGILNAPNFHVLAANYKDFFCRR
jgi:hypothetical protein